MGFNENSCCVIQVRYFLFSRADKPCFTDVHRRFLLLKFSAGIFSEKELFLFSIFVHMPVCFFQDQIEIYKERIVSDLFLKGL